MKKLAFAAALLALTAGAAFADTIENSYGNTFDVTTAEGQVAQYQFDADHTFKVIAGETTGTGAWELVDGQLCMTPEGGERGCTAYMGDKNVGDTWSQNGTDGAPITITLRAGR